MKAVRVPWSSASFLAYLGGLTIFGAVASLLDAQADQHGSAGLVGWALLIFLGVSAFALYARGRGHRVTAGLLALSSVAFLTDLVSGGGDWSAVVTLLVGVGLLAAAVAVDFADARPYGFWLHVVAGLTIGGGLLWFFHNGDWEWTLIAIAGLLYVAVGDRLLRSSWVLLGAWGILQAAAHFAASGPKTSSTARSTSSRS